MAQVNLYAGVAGDVGRPNDTGAIGVFWRPARDAQWKHVLSQLECYVVAVHPQDPAIVFAGTEDGVWRSTDRGATFQRTQFPDRGRQVWSVLISEGDPRLIYAGASPVGVYRSEDGGASWSALPTPAMPEHCACTFAPRVMRMAQRPGRPAEIYAALEINGVMRSTDGGESWQDASADLLRLSRLPHLRNKIVSDTYAEGMLDGHAIAICPAAPDQAVLACRMGLFRTEDGGANWQDLEVGRFSPTTYGRDIRAAPQDPATLYTALSVSAESRDGGVYRSRDAGRTWARFDTVQVGGTIMTIGLHAGDPDQVYFGARYRGEIHGTLDGGATWQAMSLPGEVKDIFSLACG